LSSCSVGLGSFRMHYSLSTFAPVANEVGSISGESGRG
jgi:hypothetical protein